MTSLIRRGVHVVTVARAGHAAERVQDLEQVKSGLRPFQAGCGNNGAIALVLLRTDQKQACRSDMVSSCAAMQPTAGPKRQPARVSLRREI